MGMSGMRSLLFVIATPSNRVWNIPVTDAAGDTTTTTDDTRLNTKGNDPVIIRPSPGITGFHVRMMAINDSSTRLAIAREDGFVYLYAIPWPRANDAPGFEHLASRVLDIPPVAEQLCPGLPVFIACLRHEKPIVDAVWSSRCPDRLAVSDRGGVVKVWRFDKDVKGWTNVSCMCCLPGLIWAVLVDAAEALQTHPAPNAGSPVAQPGTNINPAVLLPPTQTDDKYAIDWSLDDAVVYMACADNAVRAWSSSTGAFLFCLPIVHTSGTRMLVFSFNKPFMYMFCFGCLPRFRIFVLLDVYILTSHPTTPGLLVTASYDGTVCFWDMYTRSLSRRVDLHGGSLLCADFSVIDGRHLLVSDHFGTTHVLGTCPVPRAPPHEQFFRSDWNATRLSDGRVVDDATGIHYLYIMCMSLDVQVTQDGTQEDLICDLALEAHSYQPSVRWSGRADELREQALLLSRLSEKMIHMRSMEVGLLESEIRNASGHEETRELGRRKRHLQQAWLPEPPEPAIVLPVDINELNDSDYEEGGSGFIDRRDVFDEYEDGITQSCVF